MFPGCRLCRPGVPELRPAAESPSHCHGCPGGFLSTVSVPRPSLPTRFCHHANVIATHLPAPSCSPSSSPQGPIILATLASSPGTPNQPHHKLFLRHLDLVSLCHPRVPSPHSLAGSPSTTFPAASLRLQDSPTGAAETPGPQRAPRQGQRGPTREGAGPQPRSLFMNGGAGGARPHYYAAQRALRPGAPRPLADRAADVTEPVAGGGAG